MQKSIFSVWSHLTYAWDFIRHWWSSNTLSAPIALPTCRKGQSLSRPLDNSDPSFFFRQVLRMKLGSCRGHFWIKESESSELFFFFWCVSLQAVYLHFEWRGRLRPFLLFANKWRSFCKQTKQPLSDKWARRRLIEKRELLALSIKTQANGLPVTSVHVRI